MAAHRWAEQNDIRTRWVPRTFGRVSYQINGVRSQREILSSSVWKAQRLQDIIDALTPSEKTSVDEWLQRAGTTLDDLRLPDRPRFERRGFRTYISDA